MTLALKVIIASENTFEKRGLQNAVSGVPDIEIVDELPNLLQPEQNDGSTFQWIIIISMPDLNSHFESLAPPDLPVRIIAFCRQSSPAFMGQLKRRGVKGFVMTASSPEDMLEAIYAVGSGEEYYCPLTLQNLDEHRRRIIGPGYKDAVFTKKELEILQLICQEFSDKEIAARTGISRRTVESHKRNIRSKTRAYNNVGCINYARSQGIIFIQFFWLFSSYLEDALELF